jgi:DNA-binding NarL/FixJ family response regulator
MKIFIADDSVLIRKSLVAVLADIPEIEIVGQASEVNAAVEGIVQSRPQVVILDIHMPPTTGIDVLKRVKTLETPPIVAIFTGNDFPEYRRKCAKEGADYFFDKNTGQADLINLTRQLATGAIKKNR